MYLDIYNNITWTDRSKNWMKGILTGQPLIFERFPRTSEPAIMRCWRDEAAR